jgi:hypothetical protein
MSSGVDFEARRGEVREERERKKVGKEVKDGEKFKLNRDCVLKC